MTTLLNCFCGSYAEVLPVGHGEFFVACWKNGHHLGCWKGPYRRNRKNAVNAWNMLMEHK